MAFSGNTVCDSFKTAQWTGGVDFNTTTFKLALYTDSASLNSSTAAYTSAGEVVASGYTAGGVALSLSQAPVVSGGVLYVGFANVTFNAALTARGAIIYMVDGSNTAVCVLDFGADKTSSSTFTVQFPVAGTTTAILRCQ